MRMRNPALIILSLFGLAFMPELHASPLFADLAFKRKIIEKCDEAKAQLASIEPAQQIDAIDDLKLVLQLKLSQQPGRGPEFSNSANKISAVNAPFEELKSDDIWQAFQPDREIKAKFCAIEILRSLSPFSLEALPELIELTQDVTLPHDLQSLLYDSIQYITLDAVNDAQYQIPAETITRLISMLHGASSYFAQNALIEMQKVSVQNLFRELKKPDASQRDLITGTLLRIDSAGGMIGPEALKLLESAEDAIRRRAILILSELEDFYPFSLPLIIERLNDISIEVQDTAFSALSRIFAGLKEVPKITIEEQTLSILFNKLLLSNAAQRKIIVQGLNKLLVVSDSFQDQIISAYKTASPALKADLLGVIPLTRLQPRLKSLLLKALKEEEPEVRLAALQMISAAGLHTADTQRQLIKLADESNTEIRDKAQSQILELGKSISREVLAYFKKVAPAAKSKIFEMVLRLGITDKQVSDFYLNIVKTADCSEKAKYTLLSPSLAVKYRKELYSALSGCFSNPELNHETLLDALLVLQPFSAEERDALSRLILSDTENYKAMITGLRNREKLGLNADEVMQLTKILLNSSNKPVRYRTLTILNDFSAPLPIYSELKSSLEKSVDDDLLLNETMLAISRLDAQSSEVKDFYYNQINNEKYQWVEMYIPKLPKQLALSIIEKALSELPLSQKHLACELAGHMGYESFNLLSFIKPHIPSPDPQLSYAATIALIKINPSDPDALPAFRWIMQRGFVNLLLKEKFPPLVMPFFAQLKATSASIVEKDIISQLEKNISAP